MESVLVLLRTQNCENLCSSVEGNFKQNENTTFLHMYPTASESLSTKRNN